LSQFTSAIALFARSYCAEGSERPHNLVDLIIIECKHLLSKRALLPRSSTYVSLHCLCVTVWIKPRKQHCMNEILYTVSETH